MAETSSERLERAKALFREGNALLGAGDPERALERFLLSREALPSGKNTANAAICLERLGRYDEALEMYEELLSRFSADIDPQDRENLAPIMAGLRRGLGSLEISANVEGLVTIDGKPRGRLPRATALRMLPGKRRVRVVKEGYASFDQTVEVVAGQSGSVDASLEPLSGMGAVRVELTGSGSGEVVIDGKRAGTVPWEGTVRTGSHSLQVVGKDQGSKPETLQVLERKTLLVRVSSRELGAEVRIVAEPATALLSLDGVPLGRGSWTGRLPLGPYQVRAEEQGYFASSEALNVRRSKQRDSVRIDLQRDPDHSRWPQSNPWRFGVGLSGAFAYAPTLNGGQESLCPDLCTGSSAATGGRLEGSLELLHSRKWGVELGLGYWLARQSFTRAAFATPNSARVTYALQQEMVLGGGYVRAAGVGLLPLGRGFALRSAIGAGLIRMAYDARSEGVAWTTGEPAEATGFGYDTISEVLPVVTSALNLERTLGPVELSLGVAGWFVPTTGPRFSEVELAVAPDCSAPDEVGCVPASNLLAREPVHGPFAAISPELTVRYRF